jgi:hypothetical protein
MLKLLPEFKLIAVFQDFSVALCRQFTLPCQLSLFVNYLALFKVSLVVVGQACLTIYV